VLWNPSTSREAGKDSTGEFKQCFGSGSEICGTITASIYHHGTVVNQDADAGQVVIESYTSSSFGMYKPGVGPLRAKGGDANMGAENLVIEAQLYDEYNDSLGEKVHHALRAGTKQSTGALVETRVRRLTPKECERLQGWPDDHTRYTDTGKELSDSARYKMCGNGVSAPVAQWIGENIAKALKND
jgi:site-specific DNA-cytosine methylase